MKQELLVNGPTGHTAGEAPLPLPRTFDDGPVTNEGQYKSFSQAALNHPPSGEALPLPKLFGDAPPGSDYEGAAGYTQQQVDQKPVGPALPLPKLF